MDSQGRIFSDDVVFTDEFFHLEICSDYLPTSSNLRFSVPSRSHSPMAFTSSAHGGSLSEAQGGMLDSGVACFDLSGSPMSSTSASSLRQVRATRQRRPRRRKQLRIYDDDVDDGVDGAGVATASTAPLSISFSTPPLLTLSDTCKVVCPKPTAPSPTAQVSREERSPLSDTSLSRMASTPAPQNSPILSNATASMPPKPCNFKEAMLTPFRPRCRRVPTPQAPGVPHVEDPSFGPIRRNRRLVRRQTDGHMRLHELSELTEFSSVPPPRAGPYCAPRRLHSDIPHCHTLSPFNDDTERADRFDFVDRSAFSHCMGASQLCHVKPFGFQGGTASRYFDPFAPCSSLVVE